jgi:transcription elongation factor GreA
MQNGTKMKKEPITIEGLEKLKTELVFLKEKKRPEIVAAIAEARSHGDLKENAEYHAAKEQQSYNEGRIEEINDIIARANVIDITKMTNEGKVIFGATVYLTNLDTGEKINYKIVGKDEADLKKKLIFSQSPIGKGLIGKNKNDLIEISTPSGTKNFEIKDVKYI